MTKPNQHANRRYHTLLPLAGSVVFVLLYVAAAHFYPGGSQADAKAKGFSWTQNYWCNLLNEKAMNGEPNPARPVAMAAMGVLAFTLVSFWMLLPQRAALQKSHRRLIQVSGVACVVTGFFIFTGFHDVLINVASLFGFIATAGIFVSLYRLKWMRLFWFGMFNLALIALNNSLYYGGGLHYLPVVQKITFFCFLLWVCFISFCLYRAPVPAQTL